MLGDQLSSQEYFLVLDADTVYISPQVFVIDGKMVMLHSDEHHQPYFDVYQKLIGNSARTPLSFTSHQMLFSKEKLVGLRKRIEQIHETTWFDAILLNIDKNLESSFSEYETYGQWVLAHYPDEIVREYWFNKHLPRTLLSDDRWSRNIDNLRSISFHSYMG